MTETFNHAQSATPLARLAARPLRTKPFALSPALFAGLARLAECGFMAATGYLIAAAYVAEPDFNTSSYYVLAPLLTSLIAVAAFQALHLYEVQALTSLCKHWQQLLIGWTLSLGTFVSIVFFMKVGAEFSRVWVATWYAAGLSVILVTRRLIQSIGLDAIADGRFARRAVVYGSGSHAEQLLTALEADASSDVRICGLFDDRADDRLPTAVRGYSVLGNRDDLVDFCRDNRVDMVLIALPLSAEERVNDLMGHIHVLPADIRIAANTSRLKLAARAYSYVGQVPMLDLSHKPISDWGLIAKATLDKVIAALALIAFAPFMALVAIAIKIESRGPVLFRQKRYGFNNEMIEVLKFRSMYTDRCDSAATRLVTRDDPRVTRIGRIIRKTSIDELPQFWNVLTGQLSLVGPRPHAAQAKAADTLYPDVVDGYFARHKVKPGITGWAQINGWRGETDTPEKIQMRVAHDLYYIENWSLWLDILILARTPASLLAKRDNAY